MTFEFLEREDHYPGAENVSVRYTLTGGEVFDDVGASEGIAVDRFVVETDAVDHSNCAAHNVAAFDVDRGDDGSSNGYHVDLSKYTASATSRKMTSPSNSTTTRTSLAIRRSWRRTTGSSSS